MIENEQRKKISDVHKQIRNSQKTYRKTDEKKYYNIQEYFNNENSKKTINDSFNKEFNEKNADIFEKNKLILLNKKTLKEAMIFKEILETPVSLR
ncbi:MAG: hypothetical protein LBH98_09310 [Chitinispirillales bacterium]|nr:hypothetical protein [Chitinispirillales bacterium]